MKKLKRIKKNGKICLSKEVSLEQAVAEIQQILEEEGKAVKNKIKTNNRRG